MVRKQKRWTDEEVALLKKQYPLMGYSVCELFPNRTKRAVIRKADWLNLKIDRKLRKALNPDVIGYLDIEASQLNANFGWMYSWAIKTAGKAKVDYAIVTRQEILNGVLDKRIIQELVDKIKEFTLIYTYYGSRFDIPFIRTRALEWGIEFPAYGEINHRDLYYLVRSRMKLHRNRLENACDLLGIKGKTHLEPKMWVLANTGNKEALQYILKHNIYDVKILEELHERLAKFEARGRRYL